jgi:gamma-glutamyl-gamma-aminobutyrate hydrolase PuuD
MQPLAIAVDGSIEAFQHCTLSVGGMMWHPEREDVAQPDDVARVRRSFGIDS